MPRDVYMHIFSLIEADGDEHVEVYSSLALVCKFFMFVAIGEAYRCIRISGNAKDRYAQRWARFCSNLLQQEAMAVSLAPLVQECLIQDWVELEVDFVSNP